LSIYLKARAEGRVLLSAALIGSGVGLAVGAGYMASGMADAAADHARASRIAAEASGEFAQAALRGDPAVLRLARAHDAYATRERVRDIVATNTNDTARGGAKRDLDCLTQAVYFEARGETARGQAAVAQVVLNRVNHPAFPKTVCAVVFQGAQRGSGCQFSFACDGSMRGRREAAAWDRARSVAARALSGRVLGDVGSATHFHTTAVAPAWGPQMRRVAQVGMHVFYRFGRPAKAAPAEIAQPAEVILAAAHAPAQPELRLATAITGKAADAVAVEPVALEPKPVAVSKAVETAPAAIDAPVPAAS
jgi:spore germination cell wall hydrolase CwlJ-like protein